VDSGAKREFVHRLSAGLGEFLQIYLVLHFVP